MFSLQAVKLEVGLEDKVTVELVEKKLMQKVPQQKKKYVAVCNIITIANVMP